jgi:hypothetical protein
MMIKQIPNPEINPFIKFGRALKVFEKGKVKLSNSPIQI